MKTVLETTTKTGERRVVIREIEFGYYTMEVGVLTQDALAGVCETQVRVPVIGFAWPGWPVKQHILN